MKTVIVGFKRTEYGEVEINVPENATDDEIVAKAYEVYDDGDVNWGKEEVESRIIEEN